MSETKDLLIQMLYEERRAREDAQNILNIELRRLELDREKIEGETAEQNHKLVTELEDAHEDVRFYKSQNQRIEAANSELQRQLDIGTSHVNDELQLRYDRLYDSMMVIARDAVVKVVYEENPDYYRKNKIPFIKQIRERSGLGLKESKDLADRWFIITDEADYWKKAGEDAS